MAILVVKDLWSMVRFWFRLPAEYSVRASEACLIDTFLFIRNYVVLSVVALSAAWVMLWRSRAGELLLNVGQYVFTILLGTLVWACWFDIATSNPGDVVSGSGFWLISEKVQTLRQSAVLIAWPLLALAGHFLIQAAGGLRSHWRGWRERAAVLLCGVLLVVGVAGPLRCTFSWHTWSRVELPKIMEDCVTARRATDRMTVDMLDAMPECWPVHIMRYNYLLQVARPAEACEAMQEALRNIPESETAIRARVQMELERTKAWAGSSAAR